MIESNLVQDLQWRGMIHDMMPGTAEQLLKEVTTAYVGIDPESGLQKLMLVGVDAKGDDMIDAQKGYDIYDFTQPCPDKCDVKSPLFNLK